MCVRPFDRGDDLLLDRPCPSSGNSSIPALLHFSFHKRLSSARILQLWQVWAASNRSRGSRKDNTLSASSFGSNEMKSLWNWGSITCIMCRTCVGSQLEFPDSFWYCWLHKKKHQPGYQFSQGHKSFGVRPFCKLGQPICHFWGWIVLSRYNWPAPAVGCAGGAGSPWGILSIMRRQVGPILVFRYLLFAGANIVCIQFPFSLLYQQKSINLSSSSKNKN